MKGELLFRIFGAVDDNLIREVDDDLMQNVQIDNLAKENDNKKERLQ